MSDISAVNPFAPTPASATSAASNVADELGADVFLQLLVAQLKYQDPTSPADGTEFLAQTAQFTMVEKLTDIAEQAEASAIVSRNLGAASLVGRSITWLEPDGTTGSGTVAAARLGTDGPVLTVAGRDVPFDMVSSVTAATTTAPRETPAPAPAPAPATPAPAVATTTTPAASPTEPAPAPGGTTAV